MHTYNYIVSTYNDHNKSTYASVNQSGDLVNHPFRHRYRVWPRAFRDFGDYVIGRLPCDELCKQVF